MNEVMVSEKRKPKNKYKFNGNHVEYLFTIIIIWIADSEKKEERKKTNENSFKMLIRLEKVMEWNDFL